MVAHLCLLAIAASGTALADPDPSDNTPPSRVDHLVIACNRNNPPLKYADENGQAAGLLIDLWRLWSEKTGVAVEFRTAEFPESVRMVRDGEADLHAGLFFTHERDAEFDFTEPICDLAYRIIVHNRNRDNENAARLRGMPVGAPASGFTEMFIRQNFDDVDLHLYPDYPTLYDAVFAGELDVFVSPVANLRYYCSERGLDCPFHYAMPRPLFVRQYRGAVRVGRMDLVRQINEGLERISPDERAKVEQKWASDVEERYREPEEYTVELTNEERAWIAAHPVIRASVEPYAPPFEFITEDQKLGGIAADYLALVCERVGLKFELVVTDSWAEALAKAKSRDIDVLPGAVHTAPREAFLSFTDVYITTPVMIFTRKDAPFVGGAEDLIGKVVAVRQDAFPADLIRRDYPELTLQPYRTPYETMQAVATGRADAFVDALAYGACAIEELGFANLKVAAPLNIEPSGFSMGVRNDWPELVGILNKGLRSVTPEEAAAIRAKWIAVRFEHAEDVQRVIKWSTGVVGVLFVGGLTALLWVRGLRREIERRHVVEERLKEAKEHAESADRLKSAFLATMSHELRTPLNSIIGFTGIMLQGLPGPLNPEQRKQLSMVQGSSSHLLNLINDVLDISKIEAGQMEMSPSRFLLRESIEKVVRTVTPLAQQRGLALEASVDAAIGEIVSDVKRVEQILINLINNAIKFTDEGGVRVRAERVLSGGNGRAMVRVDVADTGIGIKAEDMGKLFQTFTQVDTGLARMREGTGLGLSICKKLADKLGAQITVRSEVGKGSVFSILLPEEWNEEQNNGGTHQSADHRGQ